MAEALGLTAGEVTTPGEHTRGGNKFNTDLPAWALTGRARSWTLKVGNRPAASRRRLDGPAPTLLFGHASQDVSWVDNDGTKMRQLTVAEAAVLQTFPADYPWCGSRTKQFEQIGNAVPPRLAAAVLATVVPARVPAGAAV
jgi:DNA (cytosine-5)-methyltransferase 1